MSFLLTAALLAPLGNSAEDAWLQIWRRLADRTGRPDAFGAQLQNGPPQYLEYPLDLRLSAFNPADEAAWRATPTGARFFVQSLDEFTLTNRAQVKTRTAVSHRWSVNLRFDQQQDRVTQSQLLALTVRGDDLGGTPLFVAATLYPRWEKTDADVQALIGLAGAPGTVRLRVTAFDPFLNAAYGLAESRNARLSDTQDQSGAPLGVAIEALSTRWHGWRAEAYAGVVPGFDTFRRLTQTPDAGRTHRRSAWMAAALLEHATARWCVGGMATHAQTRDTWTGAQPRTLGERETRGQLYAIGELPARLRAQGQLELIDRPFERRWITDVRLRWTPGRWGAELGYLRGSRTLAPGVETHRTDGVASRISTRATYQLDGRVWVGFGTGWDLDAGDTVYDGSGLTVLLAY